MKNWNDELPLKHPDLLFTALLVYIIISTLIRGDNPFHNTSRITLIFMTLLYAVLRQILSPAHKRAKREELSKLFLLVILLSGIGQAV